MNRIAATLPRLLPRAQVLRAVDAYQMKAARPVPRSQR